MKILVSASNAAGNAIECGLIQPGQAPTGWPTGHCFHAILGSTHQAQNTRRAQHICHGALYLDIGMQPWLTFKWKPMNMMCDSAHIFMTLNMYSVYHHGNILYTSIHLLVDDVRFSLVQAMIALISSFICSYSFWSRPPGNYHFKCT